MATRILHISNSQYTSLEGAGPSQRIFEELASACEVYHVLAPSETGRALVERRGNLTLHLLPTSSSKLFSAACLPAGARLVTRHRLDGIVCQDPLLGGVAGVGLGRMTATPSLLEVHTDVYFGMLGGPLRHRRLLGRMAVGALCRADRVRTSGPRLERALAEHGVARERMVRVPYRVDTGFFTPDAVPRAAARRALGVADHEVLLVSVGRFVEQKGYLQLLEALGRVRNALPSAKLVLAGGGPLRPSLETLAATPPLAGSVNLFDWVTREQQRELLAAADVYLQPSVPRRGEWMPRTILEAMAMGDPVLATDVGGIADVVADGANGVLVAPEDGPGLEAALTSLVSDEALRTQLGQGARADACRHFAWDAAFALYREALGSLRPSGRRRG